MRFILMNMGKGIISDVLGKLKFYILTQLIMWDLASGVQNREKGRIVRTSAVV